MTKIVGAALAAALLAGSASALTTVTVEAAGVQNTTLATTSGVENFDSLSGYTFPYVSTFGGSPWTGSFNGVLSTGADAYGGAGGTGRYETVQGEQILTLSGPATDYFGLWASALDGGNTVAFYKNGALIDTISLVMVALDDSYDGNPNPPYNGQDIGEKYAFFNFVVAGGYDEVHLIQNLGGGFELDNVTVGTLAAVPEPASWAMMIAGFALVGLGMRRRSVAAA
ncbi:Npun_F0296 family exosortase-dependent surface protein [Glacieibacterium frigidum]|uniref:PEP-CTERM sorting domain-containing protein n=1 Tax=Glacieibacterium frigidum TaxID=2593303 RepID=A0A552UFR7_9SPHN|nr:PEPxxWA-CTERM sorting domain-containing protein [Glacieibacterium frigidum]TRW17044.1 PEP-CTERM sorting domain-containing protein [Glacieibacterium frigidum]